MSQRNSEYARLPRDTYITPRWVYEVLHEVEPWAKAAVDCAPFDRDYDFLTDSNVTQNIATNPPYGRLAEKFVNHALSFRINCAFLLPHTWDCAKTRIWLFNCPRFACKYILTRRISWSNLEHTNSPSTNHAWYVWHKAPRTTNRPQMAWL